MKRKDLIFVDNSNTVAQCSDSCANKNLLTSTTFKVPAHDDDDDDDDDDHVDTCQGSGKQHEVEASRPREAPKQLLPMFTGLSFFSQGRKDHLVDDVADDDGGGGSGPAWYRIGCS